MLTNSESGSALIGDLLDPLLGELAEIQPAPGLSAPDDTLRMAHPETFLGSYETRVDRHDVTRGDDGRLWLNSSSLDEALTMADTAGVSFCPERYEMRPLREDTFALIDSSGEAVRVVEFIGRDPAGRARLLHTGRAASRTG